ncbi:DMT family transporter [Homoserinibacter sp. YIM 151385]|uniref:DMT family transporter n=1 Tax=Homoserinibacter sp. YIM 151385 TaxID=2985506 RepID=UPI0022F00A1F|nr:multidrug efflux SMR transporter [Homoserinibacter sp. YIM 151385]WBU37211.1 multidrug efflux SMR transporter [Homoserinibacter sp. YIM 151385]
MPWIVLLASAVLEAVWATALGRSEGLTQPLPTLVFLVALVLSMLGLGRAARGIPIGTAYAVWVGVGAALTVAIAIVSGEEPLSPWKLVFLAGIVGAVIGLKLVPSSPAAAEAPAPDGIAPAEPRG